MMNRTRARKRNKPNLKIYFWAMTAFLSILIVVTAGGSSKLTLAESAVGAVLLPFQKAATMITETAVGIGNRIFGGPELRKENEVLQAENAKLSEENRALQEVVSKEEYLKNEYALLTQTNYDLIPAMITGKESGGLFIRFTIDKGTADDVNEGDLVVMGVESEKDVVVTALVGRIVSVGDHWAKVTGVLDDTTNLSFKGVRTQKFGVLNGRTSTGLTGYYFDTDADVLIGDNVVTSGLTPLYPPDLFIGKITAFETAEHDRMKHIVLETGVDFTKLYRVMVMRLSEVTQ